ncbi:MAG: hypothetical protein Q7S36_02845 [Candidatus Liptonbacteria bacterium]|nr:hypothetical protein [Candidatus Liptonbacteria bacterium]
MNFAPAYILKRFFFRISDFFHHWYVDATRFIFHYFISTLERMDQSLAFRMTLKHFFEPLYKDYTVIGRIVGLVFRSIRLGLGLVSYAVFGAIFLGFYLAWLLAPVAILAFAAKPMLQ